MKIRLLDATLRDGSHAIRHTFTPEQVRKVARVLDRAGVDAVGVGHGDGVGGSSLHFGVAPHTDEELWSAAAEVMERATLTVTLVPGVGTKKYLQRALDYGAGRVRIATHCTEADIALQHIALARELGLEPQGDLMMPHMTTAQELGRQARLMADAGATAVHLMDSAGALVPDSVRERVDALLNAIAPGSDVGIHAHDNLALAVANTVAAVEAGATRVDACLGGMGAGAGNCRTEVVATVFERLGFETDLDVWALQDAAAELLPELLTSAPAPSVNARTLTLGYAGVPSSFLVHAERAAERFGVDPREILLRVGERKAVSGQEDLVVEIAATLAEEVR